FAVVAKTLLERQMPVHVVGIPPRILQALPEKSCVADAADFVAARDDSFLAVLPDQFPQRVDQLRLPVLEPLVVRAEIDAVVIPGGCRWFCGRSRGIEA